MQRDLLDKADLERLLMRFYKQVFADPVIGYLFVDVAKLDLEHHVSVASVFWHDLLFDSNDYQGALYQKHADIHQQVSLKPGHFTRWLYLLDQAMHESQFDGPNSQRMLELAYRIAKSMSSGLNATSRDQTVLTLAEMLEKTA